ncbi:hypothetical protein M5K25_011823 [Dendrobium thyrsiflorum]|uniref:Bulb-type lectin domain-containing protein n=1 Tax=Dendrobium thyrsiflorum TaxID=117978 RepID=A0ABD0VBC2_DENTH
MATSIRSAAAPSILLCIAVQILLFASNSSAVGNMLMAGETLLAGNCLSVGNYHLTMQHNCNLELYHGNKLTWESHTTGMGTKCFLYLQVNGELVIVSEGSTSPFIWMTGTGGSLHRFILVLQPDGNAVVYGSAVWSTGTMRAVHGNVASNRTTKSIP